MFLRSKHQVGTDQVCIQTTPPPSADGIRRGSEEGGEVNLSSPFTLFIFPLLPFSLSFFMLSL